MRFVECEGAERLDGFDHALQLFGGPRHALRFAQCVRPSAASHARVATGSAHAWSMARASMDADDKIAMFMLSIRLELITLRVL